MPVLTSRSVPIRLALAAILAGGLAACRPQGLDFSAVLRQPMPTTEEGLRQEAQRLGAIYDRKPGEKFVSLRYGSVLRQLGHHVQAVAVLQRAALANLEDPEVSAAYGKALADAGELKQAAEVLANAHTPDRPNWRVMSVQGSVADQMGHHERAQELYLGALKLAPSEPSVLSNLGLSYALSRRLVDAERVLTEAARQPGADDRVRANLAMVKGLAAAQRGGRSETDTWAQIRRAETQQKKQAR